MEEKTIAFPKIANDDKHFHPLSLEQDFMKYDIDDLLYGFMVYHTTYDPTAKEYYLTERKWTQIRPLFCRGTAMTAQTCRRHLDKLISKSNVIHDEERRRYIFPHNNYYRYQNINNAMIYYLVITSNPNVIKLYIYLLNKWLWKQNIHEDYDFTLKELREALGYSGTDNKGVDSAFRTILFSLAKQGIIDALPTWTQINPNTPPSPVYRLSFVAQHPKEFKTITTERAMALAEPRSVKNLEMNQ